MSARQSTRAAGAKARTTSSVTSAVTKMRFLPLDWLPLDEVESMDDVRPDPTPISGKRKGDDSHSGLPGLDMAMRKRLAYRSIEGEPGEFDLLLASIDNYPEDLVREFCVNQSCAVLHRGAFVATGAPANRWPPSS